MEPIRVECNWGVTREIQWELVQRCPQTFCRETGSYVRDRLVVLRPLTRRDHKVMRRFGLELYQKSGNFPPLICRPMVDPPSEKRNDDVVFVNAYTVSRHYGGPEEGGWWYDCGIPAFVENGERVDYYEGVETEASILSIQCFRHQARKVADELENKYGDESPHRSRFSAAGGEDFVTRIEDHPPKGWPERTPRYE